MTQSTPATLDLELPLPGYRAAEVLRRQIVRHLVRHRPRTGAPLFSETQLVKRTGLSRSTIRRALSPLETAGWIERQQGRGTFVGPRADVAVEMSEGDRDERATSATPVVSGRRVIRLTVVTSRLRGSVPDPYAAGVLSGLDEVADEGHISVELIGVGPESHDVFVRRIRRSQPDVIAMLTPSANLGFVLGAARSIKVPVIGTGDSALSMGLPTVSYEDQQAASNAVGHMLAHGHQRIALVQSDWPNHFIMRRRRGFWSAIEKAGLPCDQNLELWLPPWNAFEEETPAGHVERLRKFLEQQRPTAVLFTEGKLVSLLSPFIRQGKLRVPQDLSMMAFDQLPQEYRAWIGPQQPSIVALPLEQVGRRLSELAALVLNGKAPEAPIREVCRIMSGDWVGPVSSTSRLTN